ncbi:acyltransferase family protein [Spirosoma terrae]|uniref:Acyltransferase n=1 Tax=Spirosoma terrae TaxID=1968276 RepID=A0A6L9L6Y8_9BACT|nr:acyltransferase [Spirosoma terrae]NDU95277.1 acyltransferase [Spirosoma terrae]
MKSIFLSEYVIDRNNNFNLLRFMAASLVIYNHCYPLMGIPAPITEYAFDLGALAVDLFFVTSGFLITRSLETHYDVTAFVWSRGLRIYPALIVNILFCVFFVGLIFTTLPIEQYLLNKQTIKYLVKNIVIFQGVEGGLPGVFQHNPYKTIVNGSLWTLPWEVNMYGVLLAIGIVSYVKSFRAFQRAMTAIIVGLFLFFAIYYMYSYLNRGTVIVVNPLLRFGTHFFCGAAYYLLRHKIPMSTYIAVSMIGILGICAYFTSWLIVPYVLFQGYIVLYLAFIPKGLIRRFSQGADYSYGLYIYGFPIQQSLIALYPHISFYKMLSISYGVSLLLAILSWHLVEQPCLGLKKYFQKNKVSNPVTEAAPTLKQELLLE